jgi:hypothetical protein
MTRPELHSLMVTHIIILEKVTPILQGNIVSILKHVITTSLINKRLKRVQPQLFLHVTLIKKYHTKQLMMQPTSVSNFC